MMKTELINSFLRVSDTNRAKQDPKYTKKWTSSKLFCALGYFKRSCSKQLLLFYVYNVSLSSKLIFERFFGGLEYFMGHL